MITICGWSTRLVGYPGGLLLLCLLVTVVAFLSTSWCVAGRWFLDPGVTLDRVVRGLGALAGRAIGVGGYETLDGLARE
jgi:hypothetical protein